MSRRTCWARGPRRAPRGSATFANERRRERRARACTPNGHAMPTANRNAPTAGPTSWLAVRNPAMQPRVADAEVRAGRRASAARRRRRVGEDLGHPEQRTSRPAAIPIETVPVTIVPTRAATHDHPQEVGGEDEPLRSTPVGDGPGAQAEEQPRQPSGRIAAAATSRGLRVCDATSSGPAARAMPSPRLRTQDDARLPPEGPPHPRRCDDVEDPAHEAETLPAAGCRHLRVSGRSQARGRFPRGPLHDVRWPTVLVVLDTRTRPNSRVLAPATRSPPSGAHHGSGGHGSPLERPGPSGVRARTPGRWMPTSADGTHRRN